jgi:hypothetical protein
LNIRYKGLGIGHGNSLQGTEVLLHQDGLDIGGPGRLGYFLVTDTTGMGMDIGGPGTVVAGRSGRLRGRGGGGVIPRRSGERRDGEEESLEKPKQLSK